MDMLRFQKKEKASWGGIIENYLNNRNQLKRVILLVDCRHKPTEDDILMYKWIRHYGYEVMVVATKSDKLSKNDLKKSEKVIRETLELNKSDNLLFFSSVKKDNKEELINILFEGI